MKGMLKGLLVRVLLLPLFPVFCEVDPDGDGGQLELEKLTLSIKGIADNIEEMDERLDARVDERLAPFVTALNAQLERDGRPRLGGFEGDDDSHDTGGFEDFGEMVRTIRFDPNDSRARKLEERALSAGDGTAGGFTVPTQFVAKLLRIPADKQIFRPLAQVLPAGSPPDAPCEIPSLDQSGANGLQGGVEVHWIKEGTSKPKTEPVFNLVALEPHEVAAHIVITDKLLRNSALANQVCSSLLAEAISAEEEDAFFQGTGGGRPLGFFGSSCELTVARKTANEINFIDIANMLGKAAWNLGEFVFVASATALPQIMSITDGAGSLIWLKGGNAISDAPLTLLGKKLFVYGGSPVLGTKGDLCLMCPAAYVIKDGSPMRIEASAHVKFLENKTVIRASWNVDGKPWSQSPLLLKDGVTHVSPIVALE